MTVNPKLSVRQILAVAGGLSTVALASWLVVALAPARVAAGFAIVSLSSKPHLVSGGDVLLRVDVPAAVSLHDVTIDLNRANITGAFRPDSARHALLGLVTGLRDGENTVTVSLGQGEEGAGDPTARVTLTNYPITGPMISGPHEQPFVCMTDDFTLVTGEKLGPPIDANCSIETRVDYMYRSTDGVFKPLTDRFGPLPADVAHTTTTEGQTVPFVVRVQTGTVNRAIYESAILHDPTQPVPDPWTRSAGWNGKLVYTHGGGCRGGWYHQGVATGGVLQDSSSSSAYVREGLLEQGYALTSASLNRFSDNCNDLLASETHMMVKERFIESYGPPHFTIGTGGSGGSYQSHLTADNYPGVFDGIIVSASFPDVTSATIFTLSDSRLLHYYFEHVALGTFTKEEQRAVSGFGQWGSIPNMSTGAARIDPVFEDGLEAEDQGGEYRARDVSVEVGPNPGPLPEAQRYHPVTNPTGARATVYDHTVNVYGIDPETGFAARPLDNVGVQYGLAAFNAGTISKAQFLDLNARIGGFDADANHVPERHVAGERAARAAQQTGRILNGGGGLATTPVIDYRSYTDDRVDGDIHMIVHQYATRARLVQANGHADNHVMQIGGRWGFTPERPDLKVLFSLMDRWLTNIIADTSDDPQAVKVVRVKPAELVDACWDTRSEPPVKLNEPQTFDGSGICHELYPAFLTPRHVAGAPLANNIVKCRLKPIDWADYGVTFTAEEQSRMHETFSDGVCDWSKPGVYQGPFKGTWLSFGPSDVNRVE